MQNMIVPVLLTVGAGCCVLIQQVLNANFRTEIGSAIWSGLISYVVGVTCMIALAVVFREPAPSVAVMARVPWWAWTGGMFGAVFIGLAIVLIPQLGGAAFIAILVAGQMIAALTFDHFGWLGLPERPIDVTRLIGVAMLVGAVVLIRR